MDRLAELSQGWPQHINSVATAASRIIRANGGRIDAAHLDEAAAAGEAYKREYYAGLLAPDRELPDHYRVPIPSLGDYLRALPAATTPI